MTPILEAKALTKRFERVHALSGLDLVAEPGQVVALLGPNGAGKRNHMWTHFPHKCWERSDPELSFGTGKREGVVC